MDLDILIMLILPAIVFILAASFVYIYFKRKGSTIGIDILSIISVMFLFYIVMGVLSFLAD